MTSERLLSSFRTSQTGGSDPYAKDLVPNIQHLILLLLLVFYLVHFYYRFI